MQLLMRGIPQLKIFDIEIFSSEAFTYYVGCNDELNALKVAGILISESL